MKTTLLIAATFIAVISQAKVSDFNSLIVENSQAQSDLHTNLKNDLDTARIAAQKDNPQNFIVDQDSSGGVNVPTTRTLLTFKKEKKFYRPSDKVAEKRLAEEFSEAE